MERTSGQGEAAKQPEKEPMKKACRDITLQLDRNPSLLLHCG